MSPFSINFKDARRARISPGPVSTVKAGPIILGIVELEGSKYLMAFVKAPLPHMASFATPVGAIFNASICLAVGRPNLDLNQTPIMDVNAIMDMLPHRPPFLMVDKVYELSPNHVIGCKNVTMNEKFFVGHFPGAPVMPGVLIVEAMARTGGILVLNTVPDPENYLTFFMKMDKVKFKQKVVPGDTLIFSCSLITPIRRGICHMQGYAYANGKLCAEAELMAQISKVK